MPLFFRIQPSLPNPAYRQVVEAVTGAIARGELREGERLPSIRTLARRLAINPNTVARAYRELEYLGTISSQRGSGFEVCGGEATGEAAESKFRKAVSDAIAAIGPERTLRLARKAVSEASRKAEARHGRE